MDAPKVRETSMVKGNSHVLWRSTHSKPHCTESDVRLKVPRSHSHPLQKGLSAVFQRSECAGFRDQETLPFYCCLSSRCATSALAQDSESNNSQRPKHRWNLATLIARA